MTNLQAVLGSRLLSVGEAADFLGVSAASLRHWSDEGSVPVLRTPGNQRRYRRRDLQQFLSAMRSLRRF